MTSDQVIYVAALTYQRPDTLNKLLNAFLVLELPVQAEVRFLIVDNDADESARSIVESYMPRFTSRLEYIVEPEPGIPYGRNRALREAIEGGGKLLCFTDDDAYPDKSWLRELLSCRQETSAVLIFGPQRQVLNEPINGIWKNLLASSILARSSFLERYTARQGRKGKVVTSGTYNWLGDLEWIARQGIHFDTSLSNSAGDDSAFRETVKKLGGKLAWCERAVIYEHLALERISLRYQFMRSRTHGITYAQLGRKAGVVILRHPAGRILVGLGLIVIPVIGIASFMLGIHQLGMGVGILQARRGARSRLYER